MFTVCTYTEIQIVPVLKERGVSSYWDTVIPEEARSLTQEVLSKDQLSKTKTNIGLPMH